MAARAKGQEKEKSDADKDAPVQLSFEQRLARLSAKIDVAIPAPPVVPPANRVVSDDAGEASQQLAPSFHSRARRVHCRAAALTRAHLREPRR